ncbi:flap endonuclease-1 [Candidatus Pacearchaeota archaeon]|nr:flap endonuclease-1 [Candidatus Pacearchaeota archaeon]
MGLNIREIVPRRQLEAGELRGKIIAVDAFNALYQFLTSIRQYDGTPLQDSKGRTTSHLSGLFYRNVALLSEGIKLIYVFDGKPPEMKAGTNNNRNERKDIANAKYNEAKEKEDYEAMRKYSQQNIRLNAEMIEESKELLKAMGIAVVQAPSEGEAQASYFAKNKEVYAVASQDYDCLLFGAPKLIQNLTLSRKRKTISGYVEIFPEMIELEKVLNSLQIDYDQLISLGILVGTDYNPKGIHGIGQKKALQIVQKHKQPTLIFKQFEELDSEWKEVFEMFKKPDVDKNAEIKFPKLNEDKVKEILLEHEFSEERIDNTLAKLKEAKEKGSQKTLF